MSYRYPETALLYRRFDRPFPKIVRGAGARLYDDTGKDYLDGSGGAYVANLGHGQPEVVDAVADQIRQLAYVSGMMFTNDAAESLAAELAALLPGDLDKLFFLSSGSDAVEAALKLARQHWVESGIRTKHKIIALAPAYHGNTLLALSVSARGSYRSIFSEWLVPTVQMPAPYAYRCLCGGGPDCPRCTGRLLEEVIRREGADTIAAFIGETVGGSSTGASVPRPEYWATIREICNQHRILWVADEVLVGAGRTGTWSAVEPYGVVPDLMVMGKGISGGYAPLAAVAAPERVLDPIARRSGSVLHAQTFTHTPMMCAAGLAVVRYIRQHDLLAQCRQRGSELHAMLERFRGHPLVGDVRGRGMLAGIELVADQRTKRPLPRTARAAERLAELALEEGLVIWPSGGETGRTHRENIRLRPPFVTTPDEMGEMIGRLEAALRRLDLVLSKEDRAG